MHTPETNYAPAAQRVWWVNPVWLFTCVVGGTILAAWLQTDDSYALYGTPKYIGGTHVLMAVAAICAFAIGARGEAMFGSAIAPSRPEAYWVVRRWFWLACALAVFGYLAWGAVGVKNGFSLGMLTELISDSNTDAEVMVREDLFPTIPGVTTCVHFGLTAMMLGAWLYFYGDRKVFWPLVFIFGLAVFRAILWRERTAILVLAAPAFIAWLRARVLSKQLTPFGRNLLHLGPVVGVLTIVVFFGAFEYFRSWQYYRDNFDSYAEFTVWRLGGYGASALNNGAMALETQPALPLPYWTLRPFWQFPGMEDSAFGYHALTGVDPTLQHVTMLERYGTPELNNEGGLFMPLVDYGLLGFLVFWSICGVIAGRLYRAFLVGTVAGLTLYPVIFLAILETPLILYLFFPASFPALLMLLIVSWRASCAVPAAPTANFSASLLRT